MQLDEARVRIFTILRHLQEAALDIARLVVDASFERAHERVDAIAVAREEVRRIDTCIIDGGLGLRSGGKQQGKDKEGSFHGRSLAYCLFSQSSTCASRCNASPCPITVESPVPYAL